MRSFLLCPQILLSTGLEQSSRLACFPWNESIHHCQRHQNTSCSCSNNWPLSVNLIPVSNINLFCSCSCNNSGKEYAAIVHFTCNDPTLCTFLWFFGRNQENAAKVFWTRFDPLQGIGQPAGLLFKTTFCNRANILLLWLLETDKRRSWYPSTKGWKRNTHSNGANCRLCIKCFTDTVVLSHACSIHSGKHTQFLCPGNQGNTAVFSKLKPQWFYQDTVFSVI